MSTIKFVDNVDELKETLTSISGLPLSKKVPTLYVDIEGNDLCRFGTISLIQIHVPAIPATFIVDVCVLGKQTFTTEITKAPAVESTDDASPITLKSILEGTSIIKCFYDLRSDADALYNIYGIDMDGCQDLQIMENATRRGSKRLLNGLARSITNYAELDKDALQAWTEAKKRGKALFSPEIGGGYDVFDKRPLAPDLLDYCANVGMPLITNWIMTLTVNCLPGCCSPPQIMGSV